MSTRHLADLLGPIDRIEAEVCTPFDESTPVIQLKIIHLQSGRQIWIEGEHDVAYLPLRSDDRLAAAIRSEG